MLAPLPMRPSSTTPNVALRTGPERPLAFEDCLKDPAVEEAIDLAFHRRLAFQLLKPILALDLPVTPTQITLASGLFGLLAGLAYYRAGTEGTSWYAIGSLLLLASIVFDCADGMLARVRGVGSELGMLLDGFVDLIVGIVVWYGISHSAVVTLSHVWWAWPATIVVLPSIVVHCAFYDQVKNDFVRYTAPRVPRADDSAGEVGVARNRAAHILDTIYKAVYGRIARLLGGGDILALERSAPERVREVFTPTMRLATYLGLGTHLAVMYVACLVGVLAPVAPFAVATVVVSFGLNVLMVATVLLRRKATRRLRVLLGE